MMLPTKTLFTALVLHLFTFTLTPTPITAHTGLSTPCGRYQSIASCPEPPPGQVRDVNINAPIGTNIGINQKLCKSSVPYPFSSRTIYKAGETIQTAYSIGSSHGGGHCQWALSYDGEKTWVVIKTMIRACLQVSPDLEVQAKYRIPVQLPDDLPSGNVTFMWLWFNAIGQRELYSNCADIRVVGRDGGVVTGLEPLIANYGPGYPAFVNEFPNATDADGRELFDTRKSVTIVVKGSGASGADSGTAPSPTGSNQSSHASRAFICSDLCTLSVAFASFFLFHFIN
ncbi:hypothetical protein BGZ96_006835 [Linnemannia gamsii]|uniref:Lytic polysaccharide monooxygenase n=1 Tax=Linnemannia gamsii TaxID=64522 RepID=A0ABQ7K260_9FUNG|nr:hypothetical protein BGZ96_006835 [Linnemannia gamsii]